MGLSGPILFFKIELGGHFGSHLPANCSGNHLLRQPLASHLAASCCKLERKVKSTKSLFFFQDGTWQPLGSHLAATWQPLAANLKKQVKSTKSLFFQDGTWQPLGSHLLKQPCAIHLAAICCKLEKKVKSTKSLLFKMALGSHLAATLQPLARSATWEPLASSATWQPLGSHFTNTWQVAAKWLTEQVAAKWLPSG